jgi:hypothetical protein
MSPIGGVSNNYLQAILGAALQSSCSTCSQSSSGTQAASGASVSDSGQLSPFAQLMNTLQQLQQSDPTKYQQVTQQIATALQGAAQTANSNGNTSAANQLTLLAGDFSNASKSGQLPNFQNLAPASTTAHHHGHHHHANDADAAGSQNQATNPVSIIQNVLSSAGVTSGSSSTTPGS